MLLGKVSHTNIGNDEETYYDLEAPVYDVFVREYDNHEEDNKGHKDQTLFLYVLK